MLKEKGVYYIIKLRMIEKIVVTVGCRPDCIKMMPLVKELKKREGIETILLSTGQHRQMLDSLIKRLFIDF